MSFLQRHAEKLTIALIVVCFVAIPVSFYVNHQDVNSVNSRVTKVESPCLRFGAKSEQCKASFEQAVLTITHAEACAILRKAGLEIQNCANARLKQEKGRREERATTEGGGTSHGHTTSPPSQPGPSGGQTEQPKPQEPSETPHPVVPPAEPHSGVVEEVVGEATHKACEVAPAVPVCP